MKNTYSLSQSEIAFFSENMAMMLKSGIQPSDAVGLLCEELQDGRLKSALTKLSTDILDMYSVHAAIKASSSFPKYFVDMIEVGEITGKLEAVFGSLAKYYEREHSLNYKIKSAVIYPIVIMCLMAAVVFFLVFAVLPIFTRVFEQLGSSLALNSSNSINIGIALANASLLLVIAILALILAALIITKLPKGRALLKSFSESFFLTKNVVYQINVSKLAYALSTFISSGINTDRAMQLYLDMATHRELRKKLEKCIEMMDNGYSLAGAMAKQKVFGSVYGRMFITSMKSGSQDVIMSRLADLYEEETSSSIDSLVSSIVPVSVTCMTIIVGTVLASVMIPLVGIMSSIG